MIAIVNYGIGNLDSVVRAFRKTGAEAIVTSRAEDIERAEGIVLPGVGSFAEAMENLRNSGLVPALTRRAIQEATPTLGICLGLQMFTHHSEEGDADGLGWIDGETKRFRIPEGDHRIKIPQLGWNEAAPRKQSPLFEGIPAEATFYFAHSYYVLCRNEDDVLATTDYGHAYASAVQRGNLFGVQFHPEKSHANGLHMVANFIKCCRHA